MAPTARPPRIELAPLTQWITAAALRHAATLPEHLMAKLGISRRRALALLRRLEALQWLVVEGPRRARRWRPGALRQVVARYDLPGLAEDLAWRDDFAPCFDLPAEVRAIAQHAYTELLNNAIDHSGGSQVTVSMRQTPLQIQLLVSDDGCGAFDRIGERFGIADPSLAMLELSKGKLTSSPERHGGRGLFFTSRLADVLDIHANGVAFQRRGWDGGAWHRTRLAARTGTSVYLALALDTPRTLDATLRAHSADRLGLGFDRTRVPLRLLLAASPPGVTLASRADARRVASRLDRFSHAEIDFAGIDTIGPAFADELFRVVTRQHAALTLEPLAMNPRVAEMVGAFRAPAAVGA